MNTNKLALDALKQAQELFDKALPKFDWGMSALDATAIKLLNEAPRKVSAAITALEAVQVEPGEWPTCKACGGNLWKCMACHPATSQEAAPAAAINQELAIKNMREIIRRHDVAAIWARHKAANTCVVCGGSGDIGTEQDHDPCTACNSTGKYQEPAAPKEVT